MKPNEIGGDNAEMLALLYSHLEVHPDLPPDDAESIRRTTAVYLEVALSSEHDLRSGIANMALAADIAATSVRSGEESMSQEELESAWPAPDAENRDDKLRAVIQRVTANLKPDLLKVFRRHPKQAKVFFEREKQMKEAKPDTPRTNSELYEKPDGSDLIVLSQDVAAYALKRSIGLMQGVENIRRKLWAHEIQQRRNGGREKPTEAVAA